MIMNKNILLIWFVASMLAASCQPSKQGPTGTQAPVSSAAAIAWGADKDLVCGMDIDKTEADTAHYHGKVYGFCNPGCKEQFQEHPEQYLPAAQ